MAEFDPTLCNRKGHCKCMQIRPCGNHHYTDCQPNWGKKEVFVELIDIYKTVGDDPKIVDKLLCRLANGEVIYLADDYALEKKKISKEEYFYKYDHGKDQQ